jgi:HamA
MMLSDLGFTSNKSVSGAATGGIAHLEGGVSSDLFKKWLQTATKPHMEVRVYTERPGTRSFGLSVLKKLLADHFVGEATIVQAGGYSKSSSIITNSLPTNKRTRSGDLGELLATEYLNSETPFVVPIKKLKWKSDRETAMHGNDVIGINTKIKPTRIVKGECKSRAVFGNDTVKEAATSLDLHDGRPNPSTLAFITKRLYEDNRDAEAKVFQDLQCEGAISATNLSHLIFALAGNDPSKHLTNCPKSKHAGIKRESTAIIINDHGAFVAAVYETYGAKS